MYSDRLCGSRARAPAEIEERRDSVQTARRRFGAGKAAFKSIPSESNSRAELTEQRRREIDESDGAVDD
jgi:hypothetical protein